MFNLHFFIKMFFSFKFHLGLKVKPTLSTITKHKFKQFLISQLIYNNLPAIQLEFQNFYFASVSLVERKQTYMVHFLIQKVFYSFVVGELDKFFHVCRNSSSNTFFNKICMHTSDCNYIPTLIFQIWKKVNSGYSERNFQ